MKNIYLIRTVTSNMGTEGILVTEGFQCLTLELPWLQNKRNVSCIPIGEYLVKIRHSKKYKTIYWITNVPNRSWVLIHSGNYAGDVSKGYKSHVAGCVLVGSRRGYLGNQKAILNSRVTLRKFMNFMNNETFKLHIIGNQTLNNYYNKINKM